MDSERDARAALQRYRLHGIEETGKEMGRGSYAAVVEVNYKGLRCAGKKIHRVLYEQEVGDLVTRFEEECRLLGHLRHPHIVQFIGIYFEPDTNLPVLVMEFLPTTLVQCLDQYGVLPEEINYSILQDVALALRYLHERPQPIVHRDLSANNVLLTSDMRAKISDLGVAKILNLSPAQMSRMTRGPGTPSYMPPEALIPNPCYDVKVDIFSYGVMIVHALSGQWPLPGEPNRVNPNHPTGLTPVSEADRREEYLNVIGRNHPLMELIQRCLSNSPRHRPEAETVLQRVNEVSSWFPASFTNKIEMMQGYQAKAESESSQSKQLNQEKEAAEKQNLAHSIEVEQLCLQLAHLGEEVESLKKTLQANEQIHQAQIQAKDAKISAQSDIMSAKDSEISAQDAEISAKKAEISAVHQELASKSLLLSKKDETVHRLIERQSFLRKQLTSDTKPHPLFPQGKLVWSRCADVLSSRSVSGDGQAVVLNHMVYIIQQSKVFQFDPIEDNWTTLPPTPVDAGDPSLGSLSGKLLLVGGTVFIPMVKVKSYLLGVKYSPTADIHVFNIAARRWQKSEISPMPITCSSPTVISHSSALIVCESLSVAVYKAEPGQWYRCVSLPSPCSSKSSVTIGDTCYLSAIGESCIYYASITQLLEKCSPLDGAQPVSTDDTWLKLPVPFSNVHVSSIAGCLLLIKMHSLDADWIKRTVHERNNIYAYHSNTSTWLHIGNLPSFTFDCTTALLPTNELILVKNFGHVFKGSIEL